MDAAPAPVGGHRGRVEEQHGESDRPDQAGCGPSTAPIRPAMTWITALPMPGIVAPGLPRAKLVSSECRGTFWLGRFERGQVPGQVEERMEVEHGHPALDFARELFADEGWEITDALGREDEAVVVDLRRQGLRQLFVAVARDGQWERPGLVTVVTTQEPEQRRSTTTPGSALAPVSMKASGLPGPDGSPPETVWLTINGFAAADVETIEVLTGLDGHDARVQSDGSILTLVRARRREEPRLRLRLTTGETREESL